VRELEQRLARWVAAGLIDQDAAERIREYERAAASEEARVSVGEIAVYVGVVLVGVGGFALVGQVWEELRTWARLLLLGVAALLAFLAGIPLLATGRAPLLRAGQSLWLVAVALAAGAGGVGLDAAGLSERAVFLAAAGAGFGLALTVWLFYPQTLPVLGLALGSAVFGLAVGGWPEGGGARGEGLGIFGAGLVGLLLTEAGLVSPVREGRLGFGIALLWGPFLVAVSEQEVWAEALLVAASAALLVLGYLRSALGTVAVAAVGLFAGVLTIVFQHFAQEIGAAVALILAGTVLVAGVLLLLRRSNVRTGARGHA